MSRIVPVDLLTALAQPEVEPFYAVEFLFDTAPIRLWTGVGEREIEGETYIGAGNLLSFAGLEEVADLSARGVTINLGGISGEVISLALQESYQKRRCRIFFGTVDTTGIVEVFSGLINTMPIEDSGDSSLIAVQVDSKLIETERSSKRRYTSESQRSRFFGDTFFDYLADLQDSEVVWGRAKA